jgi:hypothetical protein
MLLRSMVSLLALLSMIAIAQAKPKGKREKLAQTQAQQPEEDPFKLEVEFEERTPERPSPKSPHEFTLTRHKWDRDQPAVKCIPLDAGFCFLAEVAGNMAGYGESISVGQGFDGNWYLSGTTQQPLAASAVSVATKLRGQFDRQGKEYVWTKDAAAVKMIHKSEGLCFLSSVAGAFKGFGESVRVYINPKDDFWYLEGSAVQPVTAKALAFKLRKGSKAKLEYAEHVWARGQEPVKLIHKDEGFAFLSSISGNFLGFGESVSLTVGEDGFWRLSGAAQQDLAARAISVRVRQ